MANRIMKYSGIYWIGDIPKNWNVCKLSKICTKITDYVANGSFADLAKNVFYLDYPDYAMLIRTIDISQKRDNVKPIFIDKNAYQFLKKSNLYGGEIILPNIGASVGDVYLVPNIYSKMSLAPNLIMIKTNEYDKYYYYLFLSKSGRNMLLELSQSTAQAKFNKTNLKNLKIIVPSIVEQKLISNYLDNKCNEIDKLKEDITKQIDILKEYKQSVITETVTKGLDSNVPMKNSGIDWIGKIPQNWEVTKIKYISNLSGRIGWQGLTSNEYSDTGAYLITGTDFDNGTINWKTCVHIPFERWEEATQIQIQNGDLLITKDGTVGKVALVNNMPDKTSLNSGVLLIRTFENYNTKFLFWVLKSNIFWKWFFKINAGNSTIIHLYQKDFANFSFPIMNLSEQKVIVNYLDNKCAEIDKIISSKEEQLNTLEEYKKSLIYEYVTGKKEVPQES